MKFIDGEPLKPATNMLFGFGVDLLAEYRVAAVHRLSLLRCDPQES